MQSKLGAGVAGGLIAGVVFGLIMQFSTMATPTGDVSSMSMVAKVVRSDSLVVGWVYHVFNSAVIGGLFGWVLGSRLGTVGSGILWGAVYGAFWWVLGALILMPVLLGMPAFAALKDPMMRADAWGSLVGHLIFGVILGWTTVLFLRGSARSPVTA